MCLVFMLRFARARLDHHTVWGMWRVCFQFADLPLCLLLVACGFPTQPQLTLTTSMPNLPQATPKATMAAEVLDALTKRTQDGGTEVVQAKAGKVRQRTSRAAERGPRGAVGVHCALDGLGPIGTGTGRTNGGRGFLRDEVNGASHRRRLGMGVQALTAVHDLTRGMTGVPAGGGHHCLAMSPTSYCALTDRSVQPVQTQKHPIITSPGLV